MTTIRSKRRTAPRATGRQQTTYFPPFTASSVNRGGIPPRRGSILGQDDEPRTGWIILRAVVVGAAFLALVVDQAYRPDLSRQREVLIAQIAEATSRVDRAKKEVEFITAERSRIAKDGVPLDQRSRWTGEPYQSTEHCLFDYDRRIGHLQECLARVLEQAEEHSAALQSIDAGGGRRVPFANQFVAYMRKEFGR